MHPRPRQEKCMMNAFYVTDSRFMQCIVLTEDGDDCSSGAGNDAECSSGKCGAYAPGDQKCCIDGSSFYETGDRCKKIPNGGGCGSGTLVGRHRQCASGLCDNKVCKAKFEDGATCLFDHAYCLSGKCGAYAPGEPKCCIGGSSFWETAERCKNIPDGGGCGSGTLVGRHDQCASGLCQDKKCKAKKAKGESCVSALGAKASHHCQSNKCVATGGCVTGCSTCWTGGWVPLPYPCSCTTGCTTNFKCT